MTAYDGCGTGMRIVSRIFRILSKYGWGTTLVVLAVFAVGFTWSSSDKLYSNIRIFDRIALLVSQNYLLDLDETKLVRAGIDGMLSKLDKYTKYLEGSDYRHLKQETDGRFEGIGVYLDIHHDTLTVTSVQEGTPGYRVGIKPGDRIIAIDSVETAGLEIREIRSLMRGPIGSRIALRIYRPGDGQFDIVTERDEVQVKAIPHYAMLSGNVGYIRLMRFSEGCYEELKAAITDLKKQGMESLALDLRENPGGLLGEAIDVTGAFLPANSIIVEARGRRESLKGLYVSQNSPIFPDGGLVILVDSQSASAAEIVAGAIQDHDRGVIVGTETYGKGLVQQILKLSEQSALKITASKYYLPAGRCLQKPDWSTFELVSGDVERQTDEMFATDSGRPVFGGGGILPDVYLDEKIESDFVEALRRESCFFDFATAYIKNHQVTPELEIDEKIMLDFVEFVKESSFRHEEKDRTAFNDFKNSFMASDGETEEAMELLDQKLLSKEQWLFDSNYLEIAENLKESILLQAFGEENIYDIWVSNQPQITEAVDILSNSQKYNSILAQR